MSCYSSFRLCLSFSNNYISMKRNKNKDGNMLKKNRWNEKKERSRNYNATRSAACSKLLMKMMLMMKTCHKKKLVLLPLNFSPYSLTPSPLSLSPNKIRVMSLSLLLLPFLHLHLHLLWVHCIPMIMRRRTQRGRKSLLLVRLAVSRRRAQQELSAQIFNCLIR